MLQQRPPRKAPVLAPAPPPPPPDAGVSISRARVTREGDGLYVSLIAPPALFHELVQYAAKREHHKALEMSKRFQSQPETLDVLVKLSYLVEYCRRMNKRRLFLAGNDPDSSVALALDELLRTTKYCCAEGCNSRESAIWCSMCHITCWCSEVCFSKSIDTHSATVCISAQKHRKELGL